MSSETKDDAYGGAGIWRQSALELRKSPHHQTDNWSVGPFNIMAGGEGHSAVRDILFPSFPFAYRPLLIENAARSPN